MDNRRRSVNPQGHGAQKKFAITFTPGQNGSQETAGPTSRKEDCCQNCECSGSGTSTSDRNMTQQSHIPVPPKPPPLPKNQRFKLLALRALAHKRRAEKGKHAAINLQSFQQAVRMLKLTSELDDDKTSSAIETISNLKPKTVACKERTDVEIARITSPNIANQGQKNVRVAKHMPVRHEIKGKIKPSSLDGSAPPSGSRSRNHFAKTGEFLYCLYEHDQLTDVVVHCGNCTFTAHAAVLSCHSPFFARALLHTETCTDDQKNITLTADVSPTSFHILLNYMYTGELQINPELVAELLSASSTLNIVKVEEQCMDLLHTLSPEAVLVTWETAERNSLGNISKKALELVGKDFNVATRTLTFLDFDVNYVISLLSHDDLPVRSELEVADAAIRWLCHRELQRAVFIPSVVSCIRLPLLTTKDLFQIMTAAEFIFKDDRVRNMFLEANWVSTTQSLGIQSAISIPIPRKRTGMKALGKDISRGVPQAQSGPGDNPRLHHPVYYFDPTLKFEEPASSSTSSCSSVCDDKTTYDHSAPSNPSVRIKRLLLLGGYDPTEDRQEVIDAYTPKKPHRPGVCFYNKLIANQTFTYNRASHTWNSHLDMPLPCVHHASVVLNDTIYIIGGSDPACKSNWGYHAINNVYALSISDGKWRQMAPLSVSRTRHGACVLGGQIYVVGGRNETGVLSSVERYDPNSDKWETVSPLNCPRLGAGVAIHRGRIIAAGGYGRVKKSKGFRILKSVECYDDKSDSWKFVTPLRIPRCHGALVAFGDRLFLCGGLSSADRNGDVNAVTSLSAIDVYREDTDTWYHLTDLAVPRHQVASAVLDGKLYVVGGVCSASHQTMSTTECYDIISATWEKGVKDLPHPLVGAQLVSAVLLF